MKKHSFKKLAIARETLHRLETRGLREVLGGAQNAPSAETFCQCDTDLCVSANYTGCTTCES
jgi:hypothetical protein